MIPPLADKCYDYSSKQVVIYFRDRDIILAYLDIVIEPCPEIGEAEDDYSIFYTIQSFFRNSTGIDNDHIGQDYGTPQFCVELL